MLVTVIIKYVKYGVLTKNDILM